MGEFADFEARQRAKGTDLTARYAKWTAVVQEGAREAFAEARRYKAAERCGFVDPRGPDNVFRLVGVVVFHEPIRYEDTWGWGLTEDGCEARLSYVVPEKVRPSLGGEARATWRGWRVDRPYTGPTYWVVGSLTPAACSSRDDVDRRFAEYSRTLGFFKRG